MYALPSVAVGYDRSQIIDVFCRFPLFSAQLPSRIPMLPVMQLLRFEQPLHLVGHGIVRIISEVRRDFIGGGQQRRAGPPRNVKNLLVFGLLCHLHGVNRAHCSDFSPRPMTLTVGYTLVCTGCPAADLSLRRLKSFLAINELGYVCCSEPRLLTTFCAEYGRLIPSKRGVFHHSSTSWICCSKRASSACPTFLSTGSS